MDQTMRFQEILRRLTMIDEGFIEGEAGPGLSLARTLTLHSRTVVDA